MSVADEPIGRASRRLSRRVGRTSLHQMVFADGGPILCVIIGTPYGRWHAEFTADTSAGVEATRLLCEALGCIGLSVSAVDTPVTLGIAVVQSWRFIHDMASYGRSPIRIS